MSGLACKVDRFPLNRLYVVKTTYLPSIDHNANDHFESVWSLKLEASLLLSAPIPSTNTTYPLGELEPAFVQAGVPQRAGKVPYQDC